MGANIVALSQNLTPDAERFFRQFRLKSEVNAYVSKNFPTLEQCKYIFRGNVAYTYFAKLSELKESTLSKSEDQYLDVKIESFSTSDLICKNGNATPGVKGRDIFLPDVIFYEVTFLKQKAASLGISYKYFVNINGRWIMFPKPMTVLSESN